ncbi:MAG: hypothetical protein R2794_13175 [Chitinophagales bacterium]
MKKYRLAAAFFVLVSIAARPGNNVCEAFFATDKGSKWEMTNYDEKDKVMSRSAGEVIDVQETGDGIETKLHVITYDNKDKTLHEGDLLMRCDDAGFHMDMSGMFPAQMTQQGMENATMEISGEFMDFPSNLSVGMALPDVESTMTISMGGFSMSNKIMITNRKIEARESVTTPAGTFDCFKMSDDVSVTTMGITNTSHGVSWYAYGVGAVKTEGYDKKGKLQSKSILTKFEK